MSFCHKGIQAIFRNAIILIEKNMVLKCKSSERQCHLNYQNPFTNKKVMPL